MIVVLDAGVAVRMVMDYAAPFRPALETSELVIAPELIAVEVCSAFRKYAAARVMSRREAEESIERALALVDKMEPLRTLVAEVLALIWQADSPVSDLFYLALAQRTGAMLLTADGALREAAARMGIAVIPLL